MASISIDSGEFHFGSEPPPSLKKKVRKVLVLGDFSGLTSRDHNEHHLIRSRKQYRIDKDNFDDVFTALDVRLQLPFAQESIAFSEYDDLHPDHLYKNISLFDRYKTLSRKLRKPEKFQETVAELVEEGVINDIVPIDSSGESNQEKNSQGLLDSLLSSPCSVASENQIQALIRQTIAPYVEPKENPQVNEFSAAIDSAVTDVMRKIMHSSDFQRLEASWRSLDLLNRRLDTDRGCELNIMNLTERELAFDIEESRGDVKSSQLYNSIVESHSVVGGQAFDAIVVDFPLLNNDSIPLLAAISEIAHLSGAIVLSGASLDAFDTLTDSSSQESYLSGFRSRSSSHNTYVAVPNFMLRLPFGSKTAVTEAFCFEELPGLNNHSFYLWGNSAYLMLLTLFQDKSQTDNEGVVERLPIHTYTQDGEVNVQPCTERYLTESEVSLMEKQGFTVVQSVKGADQIMISSWHSLSS